MFRSRCFLLPLALTLLALPCLAFEVEVEVVNIAPESGVLLTPVWMGFHMGTFDTYDGGAAAAGFPGLEQIAEDGNTGPLSDEFALQVPMGRQATAAGPGGPLAPGAAAIMRFELEPSYHRYFSYASMVIPSNDAFIANGDPTAHRLFDSDGNFTPFELYITGKAVNDAGTEVNDEIPENVAALGQMAPNTGVDENGVVENHPGFLHGGAILAARPNGDFELPGHRIAKITVRAVPTTRIGFAAGGAQEVPAVDSPAIGACHASLNQAETQLHVSCEHNVTNTVTAAHVHLGPAGSNGDVLLPFDDPAANPIEQTFDVTADQALSFLGGGLYVNIHSDVFPGGEIRGQIDGCFAGPRGLCLNQGRFQVSATWETDNGDTDVAGAIEGTADAGFFYFFSPDNIELDVKVIEGCDFNGHYWVFTAGTTNVGVELTVTDTASGQTRTYSNPVGQTFEPILDTSAFATCP